MGLTEDQTSDLGIKFREKFTSATNQDWLTNIQKEMIETWENDTDYKVSTINFTDIIRNDKRNDERNVIALCNEVVTPTPLDVVGVQGRTQRHYGSGNQGKAQYSRRDWAVCVCVCVCV